MPKINGPKKVPFQFRATAQQAAELAALVDITGETEAFHLRAALSWYLRSPVVKQTLAFHALSGAATEDQERPLRDTKRQERTPPPPPPPRNAPCPCGSEKKFKRCCASSWPKLRDRAA
jgi:uncharacterized protein YecA (UPF0149 family)